MEEYKTTITNIIAQKMGVDKRMVLPESKLVDDLGADSMDVIEILAEIENVFDIDIFLTEVEDISTVQNCYECVARQLKKQKSWKNRLKKCLMYFRAPRLA